MFSLCFYLQVPAHVQAAKQVLKVDSLTAARAQLCSLDQCPKLLALRDIFVQCGLIEGGSGSAGSGSNAGAEDVEVVGGSSDSGHRLLVFAQLKQMLDMTERDLLQPFGISYLRLDGSTEASQRFAVVQQFNADPTIQVRGNSNRSGVRVCGK
jgi:TATA-binding protein-associated factor